MTTVCLLTLIFFLSCVSRFGLGPLMPVIERDLEIGHAAAGSVFFVTSFGYCVGLLGSNYMSSGINHRWTVVTASIALGVALVITSCGTSFLFLCVGMMFVGIASGIYLPSGIATITLLVSPTNWGRAFAIHELAPNASFIVAPLLVEILLGFVSWRGIVALSGVMVVLGGVFFYWSGLGSQEFGVVPDRSDLKAALKNPSLWILMVLFSFAIGANVGVFVMLPLYLTTDHGMERSLANALIGVSRISGLVVVLLAGWLADRWGAKKTVFWGLMMSGCVTALLGMLTGSALMVAVFLQPVLAACFFPAGFALLTQLGPLSVSLGIPMAFLFGAGVIPTVIGAMGDHGAFDLSMMIVGLLIVACGILSRFMSIKVISDTTQ